MQNQDKKEIIKEKDKLIDSILEEDLDEKELEENEETKIKEDYERFQKLDDDDHLTHLTRCIKCGKKIDLYTYFCNSTCDDEFIKEKEKQQNKEKE